MWKAIKLILFVAVGLTCLTFVATAHADNPDYYVVEWGDCLYSIGLRYGISWPDLAEWNKLENPSLIHPGLKLRLTAPEYEYIDATDYALHQLGKPYVWGGNGYPGYDCSGLVQQAYLSQGIELPRTADLQYRATERLDDPDRGDLVFFSYVEGWTISHVGIMISPTYMVHAAYTPGYVSVEKVADRPIYCAGYGRVR